jgi:hypothetical protein
MPERIRNQLERAYLQLFEEEPGQMQAKGDSGRFY